MIRILAAAAAACVVLLPVTASAAMPSPQPSLETVVAAPPSGYSELTSSQIHGHFTATDYAAQADASKRSQVQATLAKDGFVDGYGNTWVNTASHHALIELVIAFSGGRGAQDWLVLAEAADRTGPTYSHPDQISGIDHYYGVHVVDTANQTFGDGFSFIKGNDIFAVTAASAADDNLDLATSQAKAQYDSAPDSTIPSSQWPENARSSTPAAFAAGSVFGLLIVLVLILGVIGVVAGLVLRSRRGAPAMAQTFTPAPLSGVQMSPDGNYWYDGQAWRDAAAEVPPGAQRSSDGAFWWDGRTWRPVPQPPATS